MFFSNSLYKIKKIKNRNFIKKREKKKKEKLSPRYKGSTRYTASLAARFTISAHETVCGQYVSTSAFMPSITSNPRSEFTLPGAFFSPFISFVSSSNTDASHP